MTHPFFVRLLLAALALFGASTGFFDDGWKPIFNGKDLSGWDADPNFWSVRDGAITGECTPEKQPAHNTFCIWRDGEVDDFELKVKFKIDGGNSGIQFRSKAAAEWIVSGYQADMDGGNDWTGANYEERGRGLLAKAGQRTRIDADGKVVEDGQVGTREQILAALHKNDWNEYHITAQGNHIVQRVNGVTTCEFHDEQVGKRALQGVLALQMHAGVQRFTVQFKDIALKRLPLSDGRKKIVLIAGPNSHRLGEHEFEAGVYALRTCLDKVPGIVATHHFKGWPADPTAFDNADAVFVYADGGPGHPAVQGDRLAILDALARRGVGLGFAHYAVEVEKARGGAEWQRWIGGYYESGFSANPIWKATYATLPEHPVTRGVKPFATTDEWYFNMRFREDAAGVLPILQDRPADDTRSRVYSGSGPYPHIVAMKGRLETTMWVVDNAGANRGFGFTGGHFHKNWANPEQRKVVLNALLWIARAEVPATGVLSDPSDDDLNHWLRERVTERARPDVVPDKKDQKKADKKAAFASPVLRSGSVAIDVDVTGSKTLFLVVGDGGDGMSCDWADWIDPMLTSPTGQTRLTELKWRSATSGWNDAHIDKNAVGGPLIVAGKPVANGIGTHAWSTIAFDITGKGFTRFTAKGGPDQGGTEQNGGGTTSVQFFVYLDEVPASIQTLGHLSPEDSLAALEVADGVEAGLWASEPLFGNPTDIDIDALGRVWVTEGFNYRQWSNLRAAGDRIMVLEDSNGDGTADKARVFYEGKDIDSALGICVLGNKVIVSRSPNVFVFTDHGDGQPPSKELLFTGIAGEQHDHGVHAFTFGPDGKLYGNCGNAGEQIRDKNGKPIVDREGNEVAANGQPYRQGMVFRCNLDGSEFEVLGHNFRNNYEVAVDSFGTLWQSDNDDDGNRGVRINYVMEHGNFGYTDEFTGAGWDDKRTNREAEIPRRHWHLDDPGVVPNLLVTGAGSPTGILCYEGSLLPAAFANQLIHCDAGPNTVRAYLTANDGAGYRATIAELVHSKDSWFRPSDCAVAPDGALFVADWYDPGVGGHQMGDHDPATVGGRLYRVAPAGAKPTVPAVDLSSPAGACKALGSPNLATRYLAWTKLHDLQQQAEPELLKLWRGGDARLRARALWLLGKIASKGPAYVNEALHDANADLRITGLRLARQLGLDAATLVTSLVRDPSAQVRRECSISLRHCTSPATGSLWAELAAQHDGQDRWYLEALGIGADKNDDACFTAWLSKVGDAWNTPAGRDIIWRSRSNKALPWLVKILKDQKTPAAEQPRYLRAFDFHRGPEKDAALKSLLQ